MPAVKDVEFRQFSARHRNATRNWLLVKLNTDDPGLYGLGDASSMEHDGEVKSLVRYFVERYLEGADPLDSEVHWSTLYHAPHARGGRLATTALSGIDIALWDLKGKILGLPVYKLLGGARRRRIRVYANGWYTNPGTPEQNADEARKVVDMGYTALKFDPFGQANYYRISLEEAQLAQDRVAAVRRAVGPKVDILVEAHAKFNVMTAVQLGRRLEEYLPMWYEEPVSEENISELLEVRRKVHIPIATGERLYTKFPFARLVEAHAADVLQPDIANAGGVTELKKIAAIAEAQAHHHGPAQRVLAGGRNGRDAALLVHSQLRDPGVPRRVLRSFLLCRMPRVRAPARRLRGAGLGARLGIGPGRGGDRRVSSPAPYERERGNHPGHLGWDGVARAGPREPLRRS